MEFDLTADRARYTNLILESPAPKRLILAGPGTGKTYTFKEALERSDGNGLALTFINNLVDALAEDLDGLAEAKTFHGFCKYLLHRMPVDGLTMDFDYYPALFELLAEDLAYLDWGVDGSPEEIDAVYQNLQEEHPLLEAVLRLGEYYDAVGHTDAVFRAFAQMRRDPDVVPTYSLIVVDEYQDFTRLETQVIDVLATSSPVLIAGDDDQALYSFRHASADFIQAAAADESFETFELPYCSRCPQVIVNAFHDVVASASDVDLLEGRIKKRFECFLPAKEAVSIANPQMIHACCSVERSNAPYMGRYIATQIRSIPDDVIAESAAAGYPTVLVIGPNPFRRSVYKVLYEQFADVQLKKTPKLLIRPFDAYIRLSRDQTSRVAWRILMHLDPPADAGDILRRALDEGRGLVGLLPAEYRTRHLEVAELIRISSTRELTDAEQAMVDNALGESLATVRQHGEIVGNGEDSDADSPTIVCTSMSGAKGMSAAFVFIVGMIDGHFPRASEDPTTAEVRKLLVSLTRTRNRCFFVSCRWFGADRVNPSSFLSWFGDGRVLHDYIENERLTMLERNAT